MQREEQGKIIVIVADKGGVGKTLTAEELADWLATIYVHVPRLPTREPTIVSRGNICLVDGDPQGDSTKCVWNTMPEDIRWRDGKMFNPVDRYGLTHTLTTLLTDPVVDFERCLYTNEYGLTVLPSNHTLNEVDNSITPGQVRHLFTGWAAELRKRFRWTIIDTRRAGSMLTLSFMKEADYVLMPMESEFLAMEDTELTIHNIELIQQLNPRLQLLGILPTKIDQSTVAKVVRDELQSFLLKIEHTIMQRSGEGVQANIVGKYSNHILPILIKRSRFFKESPGARLPTRLYIERPELRLSPKARQKAREDTSGYARVAEMIAYQVPPELYHPEHEGQRHVYMKGRQPI